MTAANPTALGTLGVSASCREGWGLIVPPPPPKEGVPRQKRIGGISNAVSLNLGRLRSQQDVRGDSS